MKAQVLWAGALALLRDALDQALAGRGRIVVLRGPVGGGKTHLVQTFQDQAVGAGAAVVRATATETERPIPLGVIGQLLEHTRLRSGRGHPSGVAEQAAPGAGDEAPAGCPHDACASLLSLAERRPAVLVIEDVHYIDPASIRCLSCLMRRIRTMRMLVVLTEAVRPGAQMFEADLIGLEHCAVVRLDGLSVHEVAAMLAQHLQRDGALRLASRYQAVSGGSPLLLGGLIADLDRRPPDAAGSPRVVVGAGFADAVASLLRRCELSMRRVAQGLALLGGATDPVLLGRVVGLNPESVSRAVIALEAAGLLTAGAFRHPAAQTAVLDGLGPEERAELHARAAELLYESGARARAVADHLLASDHMRRPWVAPILCEAAKQALTEADTAFALRCLRRARAAATDESQRVFCTVQVAAVEWRLNASRVLPHLPGLTDSVHNGQLTGRHAAVLVPWLVWFGRTAEAASLLDRVARAARQADAEAAEGIASAWLWLKAFHPAARTPGSPLAAAARERTAREPAAARLLAALTPGRTTDAAVAVAEQVLHESRVDESTMGHIGVALAILVYSDQDTAAGWCADLLREAESHAMPAWHATLSALQAEVVRRRGDLPAAEHHARAALSRMPRDDWGVAVGLPLGTLVSTLTAMGRQEEAAGELRTPVPDALFQTVFGPLYLRARGEYALATDDPAAALTAFRASGELMSRWDIELPAYVPWRSYCAQAYIRLGRVAEAGESLREQLDLLEPAQLRTRGVSLRLLAATTDLQRRPALLRQALTALQSCGDLLELSYTVSDLAQTYHELGEFSRSRSLLRQARNLSRRCGASPPHHGMPEARYPVSGWPAPANGQDPSASLSDAERRVATLAAQGHTNRQIANKLFITVSTVEQHLTRVYRKLRIDRREDLRSIVPNTP